MQKIKSYAKAWLPVILLSLGFVVDVGVIVYAGIFGIGVLGFAALLSLVLVILLIVGFSDGCYREHVLVRTKYNGLSKQEYKKDLKLLKQTRKSLLATLASKHGTKRQKEHAYSAIIEVEREIADLTGKVYHQPMHEPLDQR